MRDRRARKQGLRLSGIGAAKLAVGTALTLIGSLWVIKTSAVDATARAAPAAAIALAPDHPQARLEFAMAQVDISRGSVPEALRRDALAAFARAPLAEEPFFFAGLAAIESSQTAEAEALLEEARRRNPRLRPVRMFLLDRYLRNNRIEDAALELASLRRLLPGVAEALAPQLAQMVRDERVGDSLVRVLGRDPGLQQAVLSSLASSGADPDVILRIARSSSATAATSQGLPWQRQLLSLLIERGEIVQALRLWRTFSGLPAGGDEKSVYDGRFARLPGSDPFNWALYEGRAGVAERTGAPALDVQYFGRDTVNLASQLMLLRAGRYRLRLRAEGSAEGDDSRLVWRIFCRGSDAQPLIDLPLREIGAAPRTIAGEFTVAPSCRGQWLRLIGIAGEFPSTQSVTIQDVAVEPVGGR